MGNDLLSPFLFAAGVNFSCKFPASLKKVFADSNFYHDFRKEPSNAALPHVVEGKGIERARGISPSQYKENPGEGGAVR